MNNGAIGIFDSGRGGLSVLNAIKNRLPHENIVYFGDTARVPYGNKSAKTIIKYTIESARYLSNYHNLKMLVVACNTSASVALPALEDFLSIPVIGVIEPTVRYAVDHKFKKLTVIATKATIASESYNKAFIRNGFMDSISSLACPLFVPLVEEGITSGAIAYAVAESYLRKLSNHTDAVILGCTHYPFLLPLLKEMKPHINWITSSDATAHQVAYVLKDKNLLNMSTYTHASEHKFLVTDSPAEFISFYNRFFRNSITVNDVDLVYV